MFKEAGGHCLHCCALGLWYCGLRLSCLLENSWAVVILFQGLMCLGMVEANPGGLSIWIPMKGRSGCLVLSYEYVY